MWDVVFLVPKKDLQDKLNDAVRWEIDALAQEYGMPVQELLARAREWLRRIRAGEIQIYSPIKILPKSLENINLSGIILKETQEVSHKALMIYHKV